MVVKRKISDPHWKDVNMIIFSRQTITCGSKEKIPAPVYQPITSHFID
jgi:hypothetical protein